MAVCDFRCPAEGASVADSTDAAYGLISIKRNQTGLGSEAAEDTTRGEAEWLSKRLR